MLINENLLLAPTNKTFMLIIMSVLIVFIVIFAVLNIVFIVALRKRAPEVKVVMAVPDGVRESAAEEAERSFEAELCQLKDEAKKWYSELKNEILSYGNVSADTNWTCETFRLDKTAVARFAVRDKTLCLLVAAEPSGYNGTRFSVEDVSGTAALADTPTQYRIKKAGRVKYAKEILDGIMSAVGAVKNAEYQPQNFVVPYADDASLLQRGLIKNVSVNEAN